MENKSHNGSKKRMKTEKAFEIRLIYRVTVDDDQLMNHFSEEFEDARHLVRTILNDQNAANFVMLRDIATEISTGSTDHEMIYQLTGYESDDSTPIKEALERLSPEQQKEIGDPDIDYIDTIIMEVMETKLDHIHVSIVKEHSQESTSTGPQQTAPKKQRHHKRKR